MKLKDYKQLFKLILDEANFKQFVWDIGKTDKGKLQFIFDGEIHVILGEEKIINSKVLLMCCENVLNRFK